MIQKIAGRLLNVPYKMSLLELSHYRFGPLVVPLIIAGTAIQTFGQIQAGKAAEQQGKVEQEILENNAKLKEREAEEERRVARVAAGKFAEEGEALLGTIQVRGAKAGVRGGSLALNLEETAQQLDKERLDILTEGFKRAEFRESEAFGLRFQGSAARARGKNIRRGSILSAFGTAATGLASAGFAQSQLAKPGGLTNAGKATLLRF